MLIHDWTRVQASTFHDFPTGWIVHLKEALNEGILPVGYYAQAEQEYRHRILTVCRVDGHRLVALIQVLSPTNKSSGEAVAAIVFRGEGAVRAGIHLVLIDLFPPGRHDPHGMHAMLVDSLGADSLESVDEKPLTFASYAAGLIPVAYLEPRAVGDAVPSLPLFLTPERYVTLPLANSYAAAYRGMPAFWRQTLEHPAPRN